MESALEFVVEMTESIVRRFKKDLEGVTADEAVWRPLPEANNIALIVRHLRIEGEWHRAAAERGQPMPSEATEDLQREIDSVPMDFESNLKAFEEAYSGFAAALRKMTMADLRRRTDEAYRGWPPRSPHFLGFHQVTHVCRHLGQINTIRNLYRRTRGQPGSFPDNPTFPKS